jgi:hypothetical protein
MEQAFGQPVVRTPRWLLITIFAGVAALLLTIGVILLATRHDGDGHTASGPLRGRSAAEFSLVTGVTTVTVRGTDLGEDLYRVTTPSDANVAPRVVEHGDRIELHLVPGAGRPVNAVEVRLSSRVRWQIHLVGGSSTATVDLRGAQLAGLDFAAGVSRIEVWLPAPKGTLTVRCVSGASQLTVHAAGRAPVRVSAGSGAATLTVDGAAHTGVQAGTVVTSPDWDQRTDRYDVVADAGVASLTVDRY